LNDDMHKVEWVGIPPRGALAAGLGALSVALEGKGTVEARVFSTADGKAPPRSVGDGVPWLWVSAKAVAESAATEAVLRGAYEVVALDEPGAAEKVLSRLRELFAAEPPLGDAPSVIAESPAARELLAHLARAARTSMPVLLTGETGTGKEVAARLIHAWSARSQGTFVPINCAAIPNEMMEGELFGYAKGAFSGAVKDYDGLMMAASGGTVFLDEIDDTPHPLQAKLLRVLEDRVVSRLGESIWRKADFRILAATNRDLRKLIDSGAFGADLFERLAIVAIHLPPLRERAADIPALVQHFITRYYRDEPSALRRTQVKAVTPAALKALERYAWPGNIRELRNVIFGSLVYKRAGDELILSDLPKRILRGGPEQAPQGLVDASAVTRQLNDGTLNLRREIEALERAAVSAALARTGGNAARAAALLGEVGRGNSSDPGGTLRSMMKRLGLGRPARPVR
jgi:transcriptional regulator with PAS, ATPase and Fis domain